MFCECQFSREWTEGRRKRGRPVCREGEISIIIHDDLQFEVETIVTLEEWMTWNPNISILMKLHYPSLCVFVSVFPDPSVDTATSFFTFPSSTKLKNNNMALSYSYNHYVPFFSPLLEDWFMMWCEVGAVWMQIKYNLNDNSHKIRMFTVKRNELSMIVMLPLCENNNWVERRSNLHNLCKFRLHSSNISLV